MRLYILIVRTSGNINEAPGEERPTRAPGRAPGRCRPDSKGGSRQM
jgi:hypothetical protein